MRMPVVGVAVDGILAVLIERSAVAGAGPAAPLFCRLASALVTLLLGPRDGGRGGHR